MKPDQESSRIIRMKYPAPYSSQSWTEIESKGASKKKPKIHSSHAPAHSHSWSNERGSKRANSSRKPPSSLRLSDATPMVYPLPFTKIGAKPEWKCSRNKRTPIHQRISQKISGPPFTRGPWRAERPTVRCPEPTVLHLKYGLFPPKKNTESQPQVKNTATLKPKARTITPEKNAKKEKKNKSKKSSITDQEPEGPSPMFGFRAIDPRYTRQLTVSPPIHIDIKPKTINSLPNADGRQSYTSKIDPTITTPLKKMQALMPKRNSTKKCPPSRP